MGGLQHKIPRGLRLRKLPTTIYSDHFIEEWNAILSKCSLDLMGLIVKQEEAKLVELRSHIVVMQKEIYEKFSTIANYKEFLTKQPTICLNWRVTSRILRRGNMSVMYVIMQRVKCMCGNVKDTLLNLY